MKLLISVIALLACVVITHAQDASTTCYDMVPDTQDRTDQWCIITGPTYTPVVAELPTPTDVPTATNTLVPTATNTATNTPVPIGGSPTRTSVPGGTVREVTGSIQSALNVSSPNDTLRIHAGTYNERVTVNKNGITLKPYGDGVVLIDGGCTTYYGVLIQADNVSVYGLHINNVMAGIYIDGDNGARPKNTIVESNTITRYGCNDAGDSYNAGIASYYALGNQRIVGNYIERRPGGTPQGQGDGIYFKSSSAKASGGGHYIAGNTIIGGWDGIGGEVESDPHGTFDQNTIIENNTISLCADDGIQVEGGGLNIRVRNNTINECGLGIAFATVFTGPLYVENNTITSSTIGTLGNNACFKTGNSSSATIYITRNVCNVPIGTGLQQTNSGTANYISTYNTWNVGRYIYEWIYNAPLGTFDYDCMKTTDTTGRFIKWNNVVYSTLASFQAATKQELHAAC